MKIFTFLKLCFIVATVSACGLFAQQIEKDTLKTEISEVIVTANKINTSRGNITRKVDIISQNEIQSSVMGSNNLSEVLSTKPGVSVSALSRNDANWGTYSGIGPKYSTYMLNGLPIDAFVDPMSIDLMAFERIEIQRGTASVLYPNYLSQDFSGNQSPLAGTVNLILKENITERTTKLSMSYGSYNTLNTQLYHQNFKDNLNYYTGLNYENSDYTNYGTENSWLNMKKDPAYTKTKIFAGANYFFGNNNKNKVGLHVNKTFHTGDAGRIYRGYDNNYTTINMNLKSEISESVHLNASAGYRNYDRSWQESSYNVTDSLLSNNGVKQSIVPVDFNITVNHGENNLLIAGADYQMAQYSTYSDPLLGYDVYGNKSRAYQIGIYVQEEFRVSDFILRGGLRYNHLNVDVDLISGGNAGEPNSTYDNLIWSGGIKYNVGSSFSLYANAGNSFIAPGLKAIGGTINLSDKGKVGYNGQLPNPDLNPESGLAFDLGTEIYCIENINMAVRGFYLKVDDAIVDNVVSNNPSQTQSVNAGSTDSKGFELELNHKLSKCFSWFANYTYMNTSVENEIDTDQDGSAVSFAPENVVNFGFNFNTVFGLNIVPSANYTSGYYDSTSKSSRTEFKPGFLLNLYLSQKIITNQNFGLDAFVKIYNLTDNQYEMPWQFMNTGIAFTAGVKMVLN